MVAEINAEPGSREYLEAKHGQVWGTTESKALKPSRAAHGSTTLLSLSDHRQDENVASAEMPTPRSL
jgi:hypothetical protein